MLSRRRVVELAAMRLHNALMRQDPGFARVDTMTGRACGAYKSSLIKRSEGALRQFRPERARVSVVGKYIHQEAVDVAYLTFKAGGPSMVRSSHAALH
jgi:hypothetical protein